VNLKGPFIAACVSAILFVSVSQNTLGIDEDTLNAVVVLILGGSQLDSDDDGVPDLEDAFPEDPAESLDTDGDGVGNNSDLDDDGDGIADADDAFPLVAIGGLTDTDGDGAPDECDASCAGAGMLADDDDDNDGVNDEGDAFPKDPYEQSDSDSDGIGDRSDVSPLDPGITRAIRFALSSGVDSLAIGEKQGPTIGSRVQSALVDADSTFEANSNAVTYDEAGKVVEDTILSNEELFFAEANLSPNGQYTYLLTGPHIQRALDLPPEVCNVYRVDKQTDEFECLLMSGDEFGSVSTKSLAAEHRLDMGRTGMVFRADGAALMQGFAPRDLPQGVSGNDSTFFMGVDGSVVPIEPSSGFISMDAFWLSDDVIGLLEAPWYGPDAGDSTQLRLIDSQDLATDIEVVSLQSDHPYYIAEWEGKIYTPGKVFDFQTRSVSDRAPPDGYGGWEEKILVSPDGLDAWSISSVYGSVDEGRPDEITTYAIPLSESGGPVIALTDPVQFSGNYANLDQSGVGTDIKYAPFAFNEEFLAYESLLLPEIELISVAGSDVVAGARYTIDLPDRQVSLIVGPGWWGVVIPERPTEDLVVQYTYRETYGDPSSPLQTGDVLVELSTMQAWFDDESGERPGCEPRDGDCLNIANPAPHRETVCVHKRGSTSQDRCIKFSEEQGVQWDLDVWNLDMESLRGKRYDGNEVYPNGAGGNAFPGVQTALLIGDRLQAYVKDSATNQYYAIIGGVGQFHSQGQAALLIAPAQNAASESFILNQATKLSASDPVGHAGISIDFSALIADGDEVTVKLDFIRELTSLVSAPSVVVKKNDVALSGVTEPELSDDGKSLTLTFPRGALEPSAIFELNIPSGFYFSGSAVLSTNANPLLFFGSNVTIVN